MTFWISIKTHGEETRLFKKNGAQRNKDMEILQKKVKLADFTTNLKVVLVLGLKLENATQQSRELIKEVLNIMYR